MSKRDEIERLEAKVARLEGELAGRMYERDRFGQYERDATHAARSDAERLRKIIGERDAELKRLRQYITSIIPWETIVKAAMSAVTRRDVESDLRVEYGLVKPEAKP